MRPLKKMWTYCRILSSARCILAERGIRGLTMRAIARDANITAPAIYRHFKNKQALIDEVIKSGYKEMDVAMRLGHKARSPQRGLWVIFDAVLNYARQHPRLFELMMRPGSPDDPPWQRIAYHLDQYMPASVIPRREFDRLGRLLWTQMRGVLSHGHRMGERPLREMYQSSIRTILKAAA